MLYLVFRFLSSLFGCMFFKLGSFWGGVISIYVGEEIEVQIMY